MVRMLIAEFRADVNCVDSYGWTPLHYASSKGHLDKKLLLHSSKEAAPPFL